MKVFEERIKNVSILSVTKPLLSFRSNDTKAVPGVLLEIGVTLILNLIENPGLLMRSKCSRTPVRSALFAIIKSRIFNHDEYIKLDTKYVKLFRGYLLVWFTLVGLVIAMDPSKEIETKMKIISGNQEYSLLIGYQKNEGHRHAFNLLTEKNFGLTFENWYQAGYWNETYIPYTLFDGERAIANVSVSMIDFNVFGQVQRFIQLGAVMTDADYRNQGLNKFLMDYVMKEWQEKCDLIYLFANGSVLEMYPKYGFERVQEYACFKAIEKTSPSLFKAEKLDMSLHVNREKLHDYAMHSVVMSPLSMCNNPGLVLFYCLSFFKDDVYYIEALDVIVVAQLKDNLLHLRDVFTKAKVNLDSIIEVLVNPNIDQVLLGFTPKDTSSYEIKEVLGDDYLFIQKNRTNVFAKNKLIFPLLSHA